jgi:hypothetical protein
MRERLVTRNLWHSCGQATGAEWEQRMTAWVRELHRRFRDMIGAGGPFHVAPARTRIAFLGDVREGNARTRALRTAAVYALVAVAAGSLFIAVAYYAEAAGSWAVEDRRAYGFARVYALTIAGAAPALLLFGAALWSIGRTTGWNRAAQWMGAGGILGVAIPWALSAAGYAIEQLYFPAGLQRLKRGILFPLIGPMMYGVQPAWMQASIGIATGIVLWIVVRRTIGPGGQGRQP